MRSHEAIALSVMIVGLLAKTSSLIYAWQKLKVTIHITRILVISLSISVILQLVSIIGKVILMSGANPSIFSCSIAYIPFPLHAQNISLLTLLISIVRYHMASQTQNNLKIRHDVLKWVTYCGFTFQSLVIPMALFWAYVGLGQVPSVIKNCVGMKGKMSTTAQLVLMFWVIFGATCFIAAFMLDIGLALVIKKRSRVQPIKLISWSQKSDIKATIPLRSSFISLSYFCIFILVGILVPPEGYGKDDYITILLALFGSIYIPLILWLSINSNEKAQKQRPCPPHILLGVRTCISLITILWLKMETLLILQLDDSSEARTHQDELQLKACSLNVLHGVS